LGLRSLRCKKICRKFSTGKVLFGGICGIIGSACNLHAIHPQNEKLPLVVQSLFLSMDIEGMGMGDVHKNFGKNILVPCDLRSEIKIEEIDFNSID
jgi:hypothetical protein